MRESRRPFAIVSMVMCWVAVAAPSVAAPLNPGLSILETETLRGYLEHEKQQTAEVGIGGLLAVPSRTVPSGSTWEGRAAALTEGGASPTAFAFANGTATAVLDSSGQFFHHIDGTTFARTILTYSARIAELNEPPVAIPHELLPLSLPVTVSVHAMVTAQASGALNAAATAIAQALVGGILVADLSATDSRFCQNCFPSAQFDGDLEFEFLAGQTIGVLLHVVASTLSSAGFDVSSGTSEARAVADPVFSFNQEAFDEIARANGFASFDLTRYFAFEFSPGFAPGSPEPQLPVPGPSPVALIVGAVLVLAAGKRIRLATRTASEPRR